MNWDNVDDQCLSLNRKFFFILFFPFYYYYFLCVFNYGNLLLVFFVISDSVVETTERFLFSNMVISMNVHNIWGIENFPLCQQQTMR